jgi:hypothetical protein
MVNSHIHIKYQRVRAGVKNILSKEFTDWYDFADWLKQENERGYAIIIFEWNYGLRHGEHRIDT